MQHYCCELPQACCAALHLQVARLRSSIKPTKTSARSARRRHHRSRCSLSEPGTLDRMKTVCGHCSPGSKTLPYAPTQPPLDFFATLHALLHACSHVHANVMPRLKEGHQLALARAAHMQEATEFKRPSCCKLQPPTFASTTACDTQGRGSDVHRATTQPRLFIADAYQSVCDYIPRASPLSRARLFARDPPSSHVVAAPALQAASSHVPAPVYHTQQTSALHAMSKPKTSLSPLPLTPTVRPGRFNHTKTPPHEQLCPPHPPRQLRPAPEQLRLHGRSEPGQGRGRLGVVGPPRQHGRRHALQEVARARRRLLALLRRDAAGIVDQDLAQGRALAIESQHATPASDLGRGLPPVSAWVQSL